MVCEEFSVLVGSERRCFLWEEGNYQPQSSRWSSIEFCGGHVLSRETPGLGGSWNSCRQRRRPAHIPIQRVSRVASAYDGVSFNTIRSAEGNCFHPRSLTATDGSMPAPMARNANRSIIRKGARTSSPPYTILQGQGTVLARQLSRTIL